MGRILYHCMNREPEGDALMPTCEREVNGRTERFLFATPYLSKSLAFAFDYHDGKEIICNGGIDGTDHEFAIICDRDHTLSVPRTITVFAFPDTGFEDIPSARQCVSTKPVPFTEAKPVLEFDNIDGLMHHGLQIFSTSKTLDQLLDEDFFSQKKSNVSNEAWLCNLVCREGFVWENLDRNINPTPKLLDQYNLTTAAQGAKPRPGGFQP